VGRPPPRGGGPPRVRGVLASVTGVTGLELLLIRHAQTTSNVVRALDTAHPGADLTDLGEQQADALARTLDGVRIDRVYVSPRLRTRRTAAPLLAARGLEPLLRDGLVEIDAGDWEMSTEPAHAEAYNATVTAWVRGDLPGAVPDGVPGGESAAESLARFDAVVEEACAEAERHGLERVALVSHGAVLRRWAGSRVEGAADLAVEHPLGNTGLIRVRGTDDGWRVTFWDTEVVPGGSHDDGPAGETD